MKVFIQGGGACKENGELLPEGYYEVTKEKRTTKTNSALHKWFSLVSEEANEKGLTLDKLYTSPQNMRITEHFLKDLFREYGRVMYGKESTSNLTKEEINKLIKVFEQVFSERLDCQIPFPSYEREGYTEHIREKE
jgi:hypothetical protein